MGTVPEPYVATIVTAEGDRGDLRVTKVGGNLYRLEDSSFLGEYRYHDVIEASLELDGSLQFLHTANLSGLQLSEWMMSSKVALESKPVIDLLARVVTLGGNWESFLGGFLILHLPPAQEVSIIEKFQSLLGR